MFGAQIGPKQVIPAAPPGSTAPPPPPIHVYEGIQVRGKQPIITQTIAIAPSPQQHTLHQQHQTLAAHQQTISQQQQQQAVSTSQHNSLLQSQSQQVMNIGVFFAVPNVRNRAGFILTNKKIKRVLKSISRKSNEST